MISLFGALNMAGNSLAVEQEGTLVTGQNLANVNNPAYAEQQLQVQSAPTLETTTGDEGTGVEAVAITELRNALLDTQIQSETSVTGSLTSQQSALQNAEAYLNEQISSSSSTDGSTSSPNGLMADLSNFFGSLQTLSTDPSSIPDRQAVVQSAQVLTQQFNTVSSSLTTLTGNLNTSVQNDVNSSNQDLSQIATLNQQIIYAQATGVSANDLIDLREKTLEDLAGKVNITTSAQPNGAINVVIDGANMVGDGTVIDRLQTYTDGNGNLQVQDTFSLRPMAMTGGSIEGSITARDGTLATLSNSINALASNLASQVNGVYTSGYDLNGGTNQPFFTGSTAAGIGVNSTVVNDPSTFQAAGTSGNAGDNTVVLAMAELATQPVAALGNQTLSGNYSDAVSAFGSSLQSVNDQLSNSSAVSQMLTTQRSSYGGVDTDTEMTNLMQYQKAYEASAELVSTLNEMLETVVNMKTE